MKELRPFIASWQMCVHFGDSLKLPEADLPASGSFCFAYYASGWDGASDCATSAAVSVMSISRVISPSVSARRSA